MLIFFKFNSVHFLQTDRSLQPSVKQTDPYIPVYIACATVGGFLLIVAILYFAMKLKAEQGYLLYPYGKRLISFAK